MSNASDFVIENGVLVKYVGDGGHVVIPEGVTEIGPEAFAFHETSSRDGSRMIVRNTAILSVKFPHGLQKIGRDAFSHNNKLKQVDFPDTLIAIETYAFYGCPLEEIFIPENVTLIAAGAFWPCYEEDLRVKVTICGNPKIECNAFRRTSLKELVICGNPQIEKLAFNYALDWDHFRSDRPKIPISIPDHIPLIPMFTDWADYDANYKLELARGVLRKEYALRPVDIQFLVSRIMANRQSVLPELLSTLAPEELALLLEYGAVTAGNADFVLECLADNVVCRAVLLDYINSHITDQEREIAEEKKMTRKVKKEIKRYDVLDNAMAEFQKLAPAAVKKLWKCTPAGDGVCIEKYNGSETAIVVPAEIGKLPVLEIAPNALRAAATAANTVKKNAYQKKMYKTRAVILMDGIQKIGENALAGCVFLTDLRLPMSLTEIAPDALKDCYKLTIHAPAGSYAETYAIENNIPFVVE